MVTGSLKRKLSPSNKKFSTVFRCELCCSKNWELLRGLFFDHPKTREVIDKLSEKIGDVQHLSSR